MSFSHGDVLQKAVFDALSGLSTMVVDAPPGHMELPENYIRIGEEFVRNGSSQSHDGAVVDFPIAIYSKAEGFAPAKAIAGDISTALGADLMLERGALVALHFLKSQSYRLGDGDLRLIRLWYRAYLHN